MEIEERARTGSHWWKRRRECSGAPRPGLPHGGPRLSFGKIVYTQLCDHQLDSQSCLTPLVVLANHLQGLCVQVTNIIIYMYMYVHLADELVLKS